MKNSILFLPTMYVLTSYETIMFICQFSHLLFSVFTKFLCYISLLKKEKDAINFYLNKVRIPKKKARFYDLILYYAKNLSTEQWLINDKNKENISYKTFKSSEKPKMLPISIS